MKKGVQQQQQQQAKMVSGDESRTAASCKLILSSLNILKHSSSLWATIFMHADTTDKCLMALGFLGAVGDGLSLPILFLVNSKTFDDLGAIGPSSPLSSSSHEFKDKNSKNVVNMLYVAGATFVMCLLEGYCWTRSAERQASRMRARYLEAVLRQDIEYFDQKNAAAAAVAVASEVTTVVSSDSLVIQDVISEKVPNFVMNVSTFLGSYIVGFVLLWKLTLVVFPTVALLIIPGFLYGRKLIGLSRDIRNEYSKAGGIIEQAIYSIRTVYSFTAESQTMAKFSSILENSVKLGLKQGLAKGIAIGSNSITFSIWAFIVWYGSHLVMYHGAKGGTVFAVGSVLILGGRALGSALPNIKYFSEARAAGERTMELIRRIPKIDTENKEGDVLEKNSGNVEFIEVEFAYPSRPESLILEGFNLNVPAGKAVALVGSSGSGKSTVIALLERFYDPQGGQILLDGMDIKKLNLKWLRAQMGLVSQEPALLATSIKENILFGNNEATIEEVVKAAKTANAHNFISQLPHGYNTQVGERGLQMSAGQKQRIAIARAMLRSPKILLFDEVTSALDAESEQFVQESLNSALVGRTTIVIAHRLSTIRKVDAIAVLQAGQIVELGSHENLICNEEGLYSSLVCLQQMAGADNDIKTAALAAVMPFGSINGMENEFPAAIIRDSSAGSLRTSANYENVKPLKLEAPSFRRLLILNMPEWKHALCGSLSAAVAGAIQPVYAFIIGSMISVYFSSDHSEIKSKTRTYALIFVSLSVFSFVINILQHYHFGAMGEYLTKRLREMILSKILTFEIGWFDQEENSTGALCSMVAKDANVVRSLVGDRMALIVQTLSVVTIACIMGLVIAWRLALGMIVIQPIIIICFYSRRVLLKKISAKAINAQLKSSKLVADAVSNIRTITAFSLQDHILYLFDMAQEGPRRKSIRQSLYAGVGLGCSNSLMICTWALDFWYGGKLIADGYMSAKSLFQTFMILVSTGRVIAEAGSITTDLVKGANAVASVFQVLDRYTLIEPDDVDEHQQKKLIGNIDIQEVDFAYPTRLNVLIFQAFSLSIEAGKSTALVGKSGSGKSTIIGLILRFYDPLRGAIRIDGKDVRTYNLRNLRKHIGLVEQEPTLFAATIRDNIIYGKQGATEQEIEDAARAANAHGFISSLYDGYNTHCGDRGLQLSAGQKQRIAIARAILKNPTILLLDEATSALDSHSEKVVHEALERVMVGRTNVVVTHRLKTIENCSLIVVLEDGAAVEKGTHASLLAKGPSGSYYGLASLQQVDKAK